MLDTLLITKNKFEKLISFSINGIHTEKLGSRNQPWDLKVSKIVSKEFSKINVNSHDQYLWYAVHFIWFVKPSHRRDLDNLRFKPILDSITTSGFWPDDNIKYVRSIYNEVVLIKNKNNEHVEVEIYGILKS